MRKQIYAVNKANAIIKITILSNMNGVFNVIPPQRYCDNIIYQRIGKEKQHITVKQKMSQIVRQFFYSTVSPGH